MPRAPVVPDYPERLLDYTQLVAQMVASPAKRLELLQEAIKSLPFPYFKSQVSYFWCSLFEQLRRSGDQELWNWLRTLPEAEPYLPHEVRMVQGVYAGTCRRIERPLLPGSREPVDLPGYPFKVWQGRGWFWNFFEKWEYYSGFPMPTSHDEQYVMGT